MNEDGAVLLDIKQGLCFSINPVGTRIWDLLKQGYSTEQIAAELQAQFDVPNLQLKQDISEFVGILMRENLLCSRNLKTGVPRKWWWRFIRRHCSFDPF